MKQEDILATAFRVWGCEGYKKMSLTEVAAALGVTKPALYRHFKDKDQLLSAMHRDFFDRYAKALVAAFPEGLAGSGDSVPLGFRLIETLAGYFGSRPEDLAFMFARIMRHGDVEKVFAAEMAARNIKLDPVPGGSEEGRNRIQLAVGSCFFLVASFHIDRKNRGLSLPPAEEELRSLTESIVELVAQGLAGSRGLAAPSLTRAPPSSSFRPDLSTATALGIDYATLEKIARLTEEETAAPDGLLPAVAAVVAEAGSWNASMEMVARRSGLSKSGLYSHFKSKEDMLLRLFSVEFDRITEALARRLPQAASPAEGLYLVMATAAEYLLARPDILVALDWLRMQRLGVPDLLPPRLLELFAFLDDGTVRFIRGSLGLTVRWILFLTIHQLMRCAGGPLGTRPKGTAKALPMDRLRNLHQFLLFGLIGG